MLAASNGHLNVVTYLKENGADMDHEDKVSMVCRVALCYSWGMIGGYYDSFKRLILIQK